jgi:hypothetical protein
MVAIERYVFPLGMTVWEETSMAYEPNFVSQTFGAWILITVHTCEVTPSGSTWHGA